MPVQKLTIAEFRSLGFLQEVNRIFLHPRGLALEVVIQEDGSESIGGVWDYRDDPEGMVYSPELVAEPDFIKNAIAVRDLFRKKKEQRLKILGYIVQPLGNEQYHSLEDDWQHFLSYSGSSLREDPQTLAKMRQAFEAAWEPK